MPNLIDPRTSFLPHAFTRFQLDDFVRATIWNGSVCRLTYFSVVLSIACCSLASAQVQLDRFYPPVVIAGGETKILAEGKFPEWPVKVVVDRRDVKLSVGKDSGQFSIQLAPDAAPGIVWVRVFDKTSASKLVPLLIESTGTIEEVEPNEKLDEATAVELPAVVYGRLAKSNEMDTYRVQLKKGQTFIAATLAHRPLRSPMDAVMQLVDEHGNVIMQADDDRGIDPQIVYLAQEDRVLFVRIFAFPEVPTGTIGYAGGESFVYAIRLTGDAYIDHVLPLVHPLNSVSTTYTAFGWNQLPTADVQFQVATEASPLIAHVPSTLGWQWQPSLSHDAVVVEETGGDDFATAPSLPCIFSGHISEPNQTDRLRFAVTAATRYEAVVHSRAHGLPLDSVLRVTAVDDGSELARNDDVDRNRYDSTVTFAATTAGEVELQVSDLVDGHGPRHAYSVVVTEASPSVELTVNEAEFTIGQDGNVEIPITIARKHGFDRELTITAESLPEGVRAESVVSSPKGETSKSVKLKLFADKPITLQGPFCITGTQTTTDDQLSPPAIFTATHALRDAVRIEAFWLSVSASTD